MISSRLSFKRRVALVIAVFILITIPAFAQLQTTAYATNKDVTKSMKDNAGVKVICKDISTYVALLNAFKPMKKKQTVKLSVNKMAEIVCLRDDWKNYDVDYKSAIEVDNNIYYPIKQGRFKTKYKNLFGEILDISSINPNGTYIKKSGGKIYGLAIGDWGENYPAHMIRKITKTGKGKYTIRLDNQKKIDSREWMRINCGWTEIKIKKSTSSKYSYVVTGITYKQTDTEFASKDGKYVFLFNRENARKRNLGKCRIAKKTLTVPEYASVFYEDRYDDIINYIGYPLRIELADKLFVYESAEPFKITKKYGHTLYVTQGKTISRKTFYKHRKEYSAFLGMDVIIKNGKVVAIGYSA